MNPIIQLSLNTVNLEEAVKIIEDSREKNISWIEINSDLIRNNGLNAIKKFKEKYPEKKIVVNMSSLFFIEDINGALQAGADIISLPETTNTDLLKENIRLMGKKDVKIMANLTWLSPIEERSKILADLGVDYIMINIPDEKIAHDNELMKKIKKISDSIKIPIGLGRNIAPNNLDKVLTFGVKIIASNRFNEINEDTKKAALSVSDYLEDKMDSEIFDYSMNDEDMDEFFDLAMIETDLDNIKRKFQGLGKQREMDRARIERLEEKTQDLDITKKNFSNLKLEMEELQSDYEKEKKELEVEKKTLQDKIMNLEELRKMELMEIEIERKKIEDEFKALKDGWNKLRDEEKNWEERQKIREDEFRIRQEEIWGEWEEQQRKRFREYSLTREAERKKIDDEMRKIDSRWDEINGIVERINQEKIKLEGDKKKIKTEWVNISEQIADLKEEEARLDKLNKEFMENKTSIVEELKERNTRSITHLPKLMSRVSDIYKEREQELRKLKSQNAIIDEKIRLIEEKWSEIESLEEDKTRDQKLIDGDRIKVRESLTKIERDLLQLKKEHQVDEEESTESNLLDDRPVEDETIELEAEPAAGDVEESISPEDDIKYKETINSLINLIGKKGEIKLDDAARILKMDKRIVERWSKLLEEKDIIIVDKRLFGDTILREGIDMHKLT